MKKDKKNMKKNWLFSMLDRIKYRGDNMKDMKLRQLFDFQKFEGNQALKFAIDSTRKIEKSHVQELSNDQLEMLSAAGVVESNLHKDKS